MNPEMSSKFHYKNLACWTSDGSSWNALKILYHQNSASRNRSRDFLSFESRNPEHRISPSSPNLVPLWKELQNLSRCGIPFHSSPVPLAECRWLCDRWQSDLQTLQRIAGWSENLHNEILIDGGKRSAFVCGEKFEITGFVRKNIRL